MDFMRAWITGHPILATTLNSVFGAIVIDLIAFRNSKDPGSWIGQFDLKVAGLRYLQALVGGFVGNATIAALVGGGAVAATALVYWLF